MQKTYVRKNNLNNLKLIYMLRVSYVLYALYVLDALYVLSNFNYVACFVSNLNMIFVEVEITSRRRIRSRRPASPTH